MSLLPAAEQGVSATKRARHVKERHSHQRPIAGHQSQ